MITGVNVKAPALGQWHKIHVTAGGDHIQGEHKYGAVFDFTPWAVPVYSANEAFGSADSSEGWWARWVVVPFPTSFLGREDLNHSPGGCKLERRLLLRGHQGRRPDVDRDRPGLHHRDANGDGHRGGVGGNAHVSGMPIPGVSRN